MCLALYFYGLCDYWFGAINRLKKKTRNSPLLQNIYPSVPLGHPGTHFGPQACSGTGGKIFPAGSERLEEARRRFGRGDLDASEPAGRREDKVRV